MHMRAITAAVQYVCKHPLVSEGHVEGVSTLDDGGTGTVNTWHT